MNKRPKTLVLIILDGWGYREETEANAIAQADTPHWDRLWETHPHSLISGSGHDVGLPDGQMGNSEVGHTNMGAGRVVYQDLVRINQDIENGKFLENPTFLEAIETAKSNKDSAIHILGLLSPGGVHSHEDHIHNLIKLCAQQQCEKVYIHPILDGRDTPPKSAQQSIHKLNVLTEELGCGQIASISGRYYAMDRDRNWNRIIKAYELLTEGKADYYADDPEQAILDAYARDESDEFVHPTGIRLNNEDPIYIKDNDVVIFMNFRADRARELTYALTQKEFDYFPRNKVPKISNFVSLTQYASDIKTEVAYPPLELKNSFGKYISDQGLHQLRIAETEKYAHVTFFFNGGAEEPFKNEERILIPSSKVPTYDLEPEMKAPEITEKLVEAIKSQKFDAIICNFANADMVGHTGNITATIKAIETIDQCIGNIVEALQEVGAELIITSDHGNAEKMFDPDTKQSHTAHTSEPIPFLYIGRNAKIVNNNASLSDIAPTMLYLMGITPPSEMTGKTIINLD